MPANQKSIRSDSDARAALEKLAKVFPGSPKLHLNKNYPAAAVVLDFGEPKRRPFCTEQGWRDLHATISNYLSSRFPRGEVFTAVDKPRGIIYGGLELK